ncbi:GntR family transcriptional regulator [Nocardia neocaledoniensis]|uniref:GntR family transcriptional regulator n=1 Tax=Nocardia neocaledoniensis TaxID=236511 RepID=UPI002455EEC2|nr:GntR family transcriptional regulator [Nocardia neocaledoniensis]
MPQPEEAASFALDPSRIQSHVHIASAIKAEIEGGRLKEGQLLPTNRELAASWRASQRTVSDAMQILIADGYVHARDRSHRVVAAPSERGVQSVTAESKPAEPFRPAYERIADDYTRRIQDGSLCPGSALPSHGEMAERFGVSNIVIREAMRLLKSRGLIQTVPRRGSFVVDQLPDVPVTVPELPGSEIDRIRAVANPIRRAQLATELSTIYQIRLAELSSIRQTAIEDSYASGLSVTEIAQQLGLTKGRISQIRRPKA